MMFCKLGPKLKFHTSNEIVRWQSIFWLVNLSNQDTIAD